MMFGFCLINRNTLCGRRSEVRGGQWNLNKKRTIKGAFGFNPASFVALSDQILTNILMFHLIFKDKLTVFHPNIELNHRRFVVVVNVWSCLCSPGLCLCFRASHEDVFAASASWPPPTHTRFSPLQVKLHNSAGTMRIKHNDVWSY